MPAQAIPPPTDVLTLVFVAWTAGLATGAAVSRSWSEIQAGHFKVVWLVVAGLAVASGFGHRPAWVVAAAGLLTFAAIYRGLDLPAGAVTAVASLAALATAGPAFSFASAALLGAVTNAMLLGHWHLNQPRLGTAPILRLVWGVWIALAAFAAASGLLLASTEGLARSGAVVGLAFAALTAVLNAMVHHLVRTRSIMSATGILYLGVLLCLVAAFTGSLGALAAA